MNPGPVRDIDRSMTGPVPRRRIGAGSRGRMAGAHQADLGFLRSDDILRKAAKLRVLAVLEIDPGHLDGGPMVGDHEGDEVAVDVAGHRNPVRGLVHPVHRAHHLGARAGRGRGRGFSPAVIPLREIEERRAQDEGEQQEGDEDLAFHAGANDMDRLLVSTAVAARARASLAVAGRESCTVMLS